MRKAQAVPRYVVPKPRVLTPLTLPWKLPPLPVNNLCTLKMKIEKHFSQFMEHKHPRLIDGLRRNGKTTVRFDFLTLTTFCKIYHHRNKKNCAAICASVISGFLDFNEAQKDDKFEDDEEEK